MNANPRRLPCGAEIEQLVAQVADTEPAADPAHQAHCPYCQATLRRLRDAWEDVHTLANQPVPIPPTLTAQIMARVRILARHATDSILLGHPRGETRISHALVGRVIQRVALTVPGVIFASARPIPTNPPTPGASASQSASSSPTDQRSKRSSRLYARSSTATSPP